MAHGGMLAVDILTMNQEVQAQLWLQLNLPGDARCISKAGYFQRTVKGRQISTTGRRDGAGPNHGAEDEKAWPHAVP